MIADEGLGHRIEGGSRNGKQDRLLPDKMADRLANPNDVRRHEVTLGHCFLHQLARLREDASQRACSHPWSHSGQVVPLNIATRAFRRLEASSTLFGEKDRRDKRGGQKFQGFYWRIKS